MCSSFPGLLIGRTAVHSGNQSSACAAVQVASASSWPLGHEPDADQRVVTAHPRAMHGNLATMETDLSLGPAPAVADAASATIMRRAGELLRILAKHLLDGSDPGRQTEALEGAVHILPSRLKAGHERER